MKLNRKVLRWAALVTVTIVLVFLLMPLGIYYWRIEPTQPLTQLEISVAQMPLGITAEEVDRLIGSSPDAVGEQQAILVNPVMMFSGASVQGRKYGEPKTYSFRTWRRGNVHASVAIDADGKVAARWTFRDEP